MFRIMWNGMGGLALPLGYLQHKIVLIMLFD